MNRHILLLLSLYLGLTTAGQAQSIFTGKPQYQIEVRRADTVMGKILVELFPAIAPKAVYNWDSLVAIHFFDHTAFHRVIPGFMIQGGDPNSREGDRSTWGYGDPEQATVDAEFNAVSHRRGIISAARSTDPNSATSQFFICVANDQQLDWKYTAFGQVVSGINIADSIVNSKRDANDNPLDKIEMFVTRIGSNDSTIKEPALVSPLDQAAPTGTTQNLKWSLVPGAMIYHAQVSMSSDFSNLISDTTLSQTTSLLRLTKLKPGTTYYWRVASNNGGKESGFSDPWSFTIPGSNVRSEAGSEYTTNCYPNPARNSVTIPLLGSEPNVARINVIDDAGRILLSYSAKENSGVDKIVLPLAEIPRGNYLIEITDQKGSRYEKISVE